MRSKRGDYEVSLSGHNLEPYIAGAHVSSLADGLNTCSIDLSLSNRELKEIKGASAWPSKATVRWNGKTLFEGRLFKVATSGLSGVGLEFRDSLIETTKTTRHETLSAQTLKSLLEELLERHSFSLKFHGDFSCEVSTLSLAGHSTLEILYKLSHNYGFFFFLDSALGELSLVRAGGYSAKREIGIDEVLSFSSDHSGAYGLDDVKVSYFDPTNASRHETIIDRGKLYSPLKEYTGHGPHQDKSEWASGKGSLAVAASDKFHFTNSESIAKYSLSKKSLFQDIVTIRSETLIAKPGELLAVEDFSHFQNGNYFLHSYNLSLSSSIPIGTFTAIRP